MDLLNKRYKEALNRNNREATDDIQRYLFLDIDGVLNTVRYSDYLIDNDEDETDEDGAIFDPEAVANLAYIIEKIPDVNIVISSTWRLKGWEWMNKLWKKRELPGEIYSFTPVLDMVCFVDIVSEINSKSVYPYGTKGLEINEWLRLYACRDYQVYKYVILDDESDYLVRNSEYAILCDPKVGITKEDAERAIEILL